MKKLFALLLCLVLLTACGQKPTLPENNPPDPDYQVEKNETSDKPEPTSPAPAEDIVSTDHISPTQEIPSESIGQMVSVVVLGLEGEIIFTASAPYREGITVFDLLTETAKEKNIPVVFSGSKSSPYITSIYGLSEKQHGPSSGWVYSVNGETVMVSSNKCVLDPGDCAEWKYITEF